MSINKASTHPDNWLREHAGVPEKVDLGLARCHSVLEKLNLTCPPYQIISVAGTNGKGSTLAFLDSILSDAGYLTGRYTSPHLIEFNERIQVAQVALPDTPILHAFETIQATADGIPLTYFEYATIAALLLFAEQQVDVALLEVGLGGRLDAVNAVDADVAVITSIALDHQDWLGDSLDSIALEKAGIMRPYRPCILAAGNMPENLTIHAKSINASLIQLGMHYEYKRYPALGGVTAQWRWKNNEYDFVLPIPGLSADIQIQNAASAIAALSQSSLWPIDERHLCNGLKEVSIKGRMQTTEFNGRQWLLDVAHNPAAMEVLVESMNLGQQFLKIENVVFAMLMDKDANACIELLKPYVKHWFICELDSPRSYKVTSLRMLLLEAGIDATYIHVSDTVSAACELVDQQTAPDNGVLICGSFYTVGAALEFMQTA